MQTSDSVSRLVDAAVEAARLEALSELQILDTLPEAAFDDMAWLAARLCNAPISLVSLVDGARTWFKARCGFDAQECPREIAFCTYALTSNDILEIEDTQLDPRFAHNPLVTGGPKIRFYAGAPLYDGAGHRFGTLCVIDQQPRKLTAEQRDGLQRLARRTSETLEARRQQILANARERSITQLLEALPDAVVTCDRTGMLKEFNTVARDWHGIDLRELPPQAWQHHVDLCEADGLRPLAADQFPLMRAWKGERVRELRIVMRARNQPLRHISCNADPLWGTDGKLLGAVCVMHDVTQLFASQEKALIEAQRFAGAFAAASQGMALVSTDGRWLDVNDALCRMLGYGRDELLGLDFQRMTHPEDLGGNLALVENLLAGRHASYQVEKRYFHRNGSTIYAHLSVSLVRDAKGEPLHFVSQIQDLTQRHLTEKRLRESEQRLRSVLENSYDAFVSVDDSEAIVDWNRAAEATFGWRRSEVLGRSVTEVIVPPLLRGTHRAAMQRHLRTGESAQFEQRLQLTALHRSGHEFPVEMTVSSVQLGSRKVFHAFLHDISARRAAEERLRSSEERLRTVADNVPALIGHVGPDLRYRFVNQPYAEWVGRPAEDIVGRLMSEVLASDHFEALRSRLDQVLAGEVVSFTMEVAGRDGELRHMAANYIPDTRQKGGPEHGGFHLMEHDVTAQTRLARMLEERAMTDDLTGLPNRVAWTAELERGVARARRAGAPVAVMFLDLDGFKQINDVYGHASGDAALRAFADRLRASLRKSDFIARLAGDEFVVLLDRVTHPPQDLGQVADKLLHAMEPAVVVGGHGLRLRPSIGFAVQNGPDFDLAHLMQQADEAMYEAKRAKDLPYVVRT